MEYLRYAGLLQEVAPGQEDTGSEDAGQRSKGSVEREICLQELEIRKLELQLQYEREERERDREESQRAREHEVEMAGEARARVETSYSSTDHSFMYKARNFILKFYEDEPDDLFSGFEEVALAIAWPREK